MEEIGTEGVITVEESNTAQDELEIVEGMQLAQGYISPYFINDQQNQPPKRMLSQKMKGQLFLNHQKRTQNNMMRPVY